MLPRTRPASRCTVWIVALATLAALMWWPLPADAHPYLIETIPQAGRAVDIPPREIGLVFDERVSLGPQAIVLDGQARGVVPTTEPDRSPAAGGYKVAVRPEEPVSRSPGRSANGPSSSAAPLTAWTRHR